MKRSVLLVILPLLCHGLAAASSDQICDHVLQSRYCDAWYGGDYHTACQFCGRGRSCPPGRLSGRKIVSEDIR